MHVNSGSTRRDMDPPAETVDSTPDTTLIPEQELVDIDVNAHDTAFAAAATGTSNDTESSPETTQPDQVVEASKKLEAGVPPGPATEREVEKGTGQFDPGTVSQDAEGPTKEPAPAATMEYSILSESTEAGRPASSASANKPAPYDNSHARQADGILPHAADIPSGQDAPPASHPASDPTPPTPPAPSAGPVPLTTTSQTTIQSAEPTADAPLHSNQGSASSTPQHASQSAAGPPPSLLGNSGPAGSPTPVLPASMLGLSEKAYDYLARGLKAMDVEISQGPGLPYRMVHVVIDYTQVENKPVLGGYRNKRSGAVYHHTTTQTPRTPKFANVTPKVEREVQTKNKKATSQQTVREAATQMARPGVLLNENNDREYTPGPYFTADQLAELKGQATITIQRFTRGWLARRRARRLEMLKGEREDFLMTQELREQQLSEERRRKEIERRMRPRSGADFEVLYNELEGWRLQETRRIKESALSPEKQHFALQQLLQKETKLLQTIDRLKVAANLENKEVRVHATLKDMAKPKTWDLKNGVKVEVHTPHTTRAQELMQLYKGLNLAQLTIDERLDVLLHVKWTVKEFDCNLTREIVDLIEREADLLNRGRESKSLQGLRKRISSLFLAFIETPEFNPESSRFQVVPVDFQENFVYERVERSTARAAAVSARF